MTATYTFDIFTSLDGNASYGPPGDWGGYWGKQGPEFLDHRLKAYDGEQRMAFGATTFGLFLQMLPVIAGQTGDEPVFAGAGDFDLDLLETRTLDGRTQELVYRPALRTWSAT
jgi:hypothetical protein